MSEMRELTDTELDAVCGGGHHLHYGGGITLLKPASFRTSSKASMASFRTI